MFTFACMEMYFQEHLDQNLQYYLIKLIDLEIYF